MLVVLERQVSTKLLMLYNNVTSVIPQVGSEEGGVYTALPIPIPVPCKGREAFLCLTSSTEIEYA